MKQPLLKQQWVLNVQDLDGEHAEVKRALKELMKGRPNGSARLIALCDLEEFSFAAEDYGLTWDWPAVLMAFLKEQVPGLGEAEQVVIFYYW